MLISGKTARAADLLKINLQLFAEEPTPAPEPVEPAKTPDPATPDPEPVQSFKDDPANKAFAEMRRRAEKAEKDREIAKKYSKDYGVFSEEDIAEKYGHQGIKNLDDMERAIEADAYRQKGIDPDALNQLIDRHPTVQQAKQLTEQQKFNMEAQELAKDFNDTFGRQISPDDVTDEVIAYRKAKSVSLAEAYFFVNRKGIKTMLEKERSAAAQKALDDHKRQASRGVESSDSAPLSDTTLDFTPDQKSWAEKRVKQGLYKSLDEAYKWLKKK